MAKKSTSKKDEHQLRLPFKNKVKVAEHEEVTRRALMRVVNAQVLAKAGVKLAKEEKEAIRRTVRH